MSQHTAPALETLARNLRRLRVARRWTLSDLATAAATGKATLSAIENARANPTVETLATLARALDVELTALLEATPADEVTLMRASEGDPDGERLVRLGPIGAGELHRAEFEPRSTVSARARPSGSRAHVVVTRGTVVAGPPERVVELGRGDYLSFPADHPFEFSTGRASAAAVVVIES
jgi:transcriptional regulator with XRE-family HTH domain